VNALDSAKEEQMLKGTSPLTGQRWAVLGMVAILGLALVGTGSAAASSSSTAVIAKKCRRKRGRSAVSAKKCKKHGATTPGTTPQPPTGLPLTSSEVTTRLRQDALAYCNVDPDCIGYNYEPGTGEPTCSSKSTYSWDCGGYTLESGTSPHPFAHCTFADVVARDGYNGLKSHLDTTFGGTGGSPPGWLCT
jgi:hypothetical protein